MRVLQIGAGNLKLGELMRFVSRSVVTGFVNALAILIFMAQLPELTNVTWHVYAMTATGLGIISSMQHFQGLVRQTLLLYANFHIFAYPYVQTLKWSARRQCPG